METSKVAVIVGIGPGNGSALARRFSRAGYATALLSRTTQTSSALTSELGEHCRAFACDAVDADSVQAAMQRIEQELGTVNTLVYNAGNAIRGDIESVAPADFELSWRTNTLGLVHCAQAVIPQMRVAGVGNIAVIGATASIRGGRNFAAFASSKAAQRSLAQSMARHLGPVGVHVSYFIIDGVIDLPRSRERLPDAPDTFFLRADDIAETVYQVTEQSRSAWSFEVDLRPFAEQW